MSRAAEKGDERVMKLLLENGVRPDFEDEEGQTPLSRADSQIIVDLLKSYCDADRSHQKRRRKRETKRDATEQQVYV